MTHEEWCIFQQNIEKARKESNERLYNEFIQHCERVESKNQRETLKQELKQELLSEMEMMIRATFDRRIQQELLYALNRTTFKLK